MIINAVFFMFAFLAGSFFGMRQTLKTMQISIALRISEAAKKKNVGGNVNEDLKLEGEIRGYERILREGPSNLSEQRNR